MRLRPALLALALSCCCPLALAAEHAQRNFLNPAQLRQALTSSDATVRLDALDWHDVERWIELAPKLVADPDERIRARMVWYLSQAQFDKDRQALIDRLATDPSVVVRAAIAGFGLTPDRILLRLAGEKNWRINAALAGNGFAPPEALDQIAAQLPAHAARAKLDAGTIELIRDSADALVNNLHTRPETLDAIYARGVLHVHVGGEAIFNMANAWHDSPNWPAARLVEFALAYSKDTSEDDPKERRFWQQIDQMRKSKPATEVLAAMLQGPIYYLRSAAVSSRFTPVSALQAYYQGGHLAKDETMDYFARNPALDKAFRLTVIARLNKNNYTDFVYPITKHADLDPELLEAMIKRCRSFGKQGEVLLYIEQMQQQLRVQQQRALLK
ncbi:HEAT repeat domain-containing protein [Chitinimonas sp.]|uniref:HEAT repeat domain-containing protein n=1 Tax=Chitinimonas sp. TaxID=1934313 RepID=UPI0035B38037